MIPYGGKKKRLGTNLISWSVPYDETYVTIDMATTVHSLSGVAKAVVEGSPFPFPVYDQEGSETLDSSGFSSPDDFLTRGAMIPLGGLKAQSGGERSEAGYKGSGLAMLIELDNVIGGGFSTYIDPTVHDRGRWIRQSFEAWRIDTLLPREAALAEIARTVEDIRAHGDPEMLLPGEQELRHRERSLREGIAYQAVQIERLNALGKEVDLESLKPVS
jgi:LDH2 family malate/lactate/ureidoglycolate dehydrogenase